MKKLRKVKLTQTRATLTWKPPKENGGSRITHYQYRIKKKGGAWGDWQGKKTRNLKLSGTNRFSEKFTKLTKRQRLTPNSSYIIEVRAKNSMGHGPAKGLRFRTKSGVLVLPGNG